MKKKQQFVVWGLGRFGVSVARTLAGLGHEVLGIDSDAEIVQSMSHELTHVVTVENIDEETVKALGLRNFDVAVVGIGDLEANMLCTMILKEAGIPLIVAKASNNLHGKMLEKIGADKIIYPERDMGQRVAHNLSSSGILDYIELADNLSIMEIEVPAVYIGKSLIEADLRKNYEVNVVAVKRRGRTQVNPNPNEKFIKGDIMVILGTHESIMALEEGV